jgi:acetamidase/formamidase
MDEVDTSSGLGPVGKEEAWNAVRVAEVKGEVCSGVVIKGIEVDADEEIGVIGVGSKDGEIGHGTSPSG